MKQAKKSRAHLERILLICGDPNAGKSRLIRHMLTDPRLGDLLPPAVRIPSRALSRERCLSVRVTSPHEMDESPGEFHDKIDQAAATAWSSFWRINYASAVQPRPAKRMPGIVDVCDGLISAFTPERIRVIQLAPDQAGAMGGALTPAEIDGLRQLDVEVLAMDARRSGHAAEPGNVRILADFFDFS